MKKLLATALLLTAGLSTSAHAGFISGNYTLSNGNSVALQGLEWMPLSYTAGLARLEIETATGWQDRFNNSWTSSDWRYASEEEAETLLSSLWGGNYQGAAKDNAPGAFWFIENFGGLGYDSGFGYQRIDGTGVYNGNTGLDYSGFMFGNTSTCNQYGCTTRYGTVHIAQNLTIDINSLNFNTNVVEKSYVANSGAVGELNNTVPSFNNYYSDGIYKYQLYKNSLPGSTVGSLLVRTAQPVINDVPSPDTLGFFVFGIVSIAIARFKR